MLGKLIKHEFKSTAQTYGLIYLILIAVTIVNKIFWVIDVDNPVIEIFRAIFAAIDIIVFIAVFVITIVYILYRFYKTMISNEGYLTFTLPVTPSQLILSKTIVAFVWTIVTSIVILLGAFILVFNTDMYANVSILLKQIKLFMDSIGGSYTLVLIYFVAMIISSITSILMLYSSMGIGQLFNKHKVWGSILGYIIFYIIMQVVLTILLVLGSVSNFFTDSGIYYNEAEIESLNDLIIFLDTYIGLFQTYLIIATLINIVFIFIYFFISKFIFTKKLNLQ